jgi:hypothetical protein
MVDRSRLYDDPLYFFDPAGSAIMKLTPQAAEEVCREAADRKFAIVMIEGGNRNNDHFYASVDCVWKGIDPPAPDEEILSNNQSAAKFIVEKSENYNAFIITAAPVSGYLHRK